MLKKTIRIIALVLGLIALFVLLEISFENYKKNNENINQNQNQENETELPDPAPMLPVPNIDDLTNENTKPADDIELPEPENSEESINPVDQNGESLSTTALPEDHFLYNFVEKFIQIAENEPKDPQKESGWTKYGDYFGDPYAQWCTEFAIWSLCMAEEEMQTEYMDKYFPKRDSAYRCVVWHKNNGTFMLKGEYVPRRGDLIYFDYDFDKNSDHTGIVTGVEYDTDEDKIFVLTIEGNLPEDYPNGSIKSRRLAIDKNIIYGYGTFNLD